jgi:superfamily I DNA and RNA helicase
LKVTSHKLVATIEGAKGLIRPKKRHPDLKDGSKGRQAAQVEGAITLFDQQQKIGMMGQIMGPERIRGLAGSGKTVVLAMKAAQTHLQNPDAKIAYTFNTKSLYQLVKRLITRFYRQFDDRDPDFENHVHVMHAWGGKSASGVYSIACEAHGVSPIQYQEAPARDKFDFVCKDLIAKQKINPIYDYVFVDEGQDFPLSFIRLCHSLAKEGKFVLAYDDLQTIFQATTPSAKEIFGENEKGEPLASFLEDTILYKCYRNPREVLVTAHALGFSLYGPRIVQMIESDEHWEDVGYEVQEGNFKAGSLMRIERPAGNSLPLISEQNSFDDIIQCHVLKNMVEEANFVAERIEANLADGLEPEDILVVSVDDRNSKDYLRQVELALHKRKISSNNLHDDTFGIRDFSKDGRVSLATVHKAKGNEAFMVYVVGVDAVMTPCSVRNRNMLFTALTRAKGWVCVTGIGNEAAQCQEEMAKAKANYPFLVFEYPKPAEVKRMKRDLAEVADKRMKARRMLAELKRDFSEAELSQLLNETKLQSAGKPARKQFTFKPRKQ